MFRSIIFIILTFIISTLVHSQECQTVASVFSTNICKSQISIESNRKLEKNVRTAKERDKLIFLINEISRENLIPKISYEVTDEDIDLFLDEKKEDSEKEKIWRNRIIITINYLLENYKYEEKYSKRLKDGLKSQRGFLDSLKYAEDNLARRKKFPSFKKNMDAEIVRSIKRRKIFIEIIQKYGSFKAYSNVMLAEGKLKVHDEKYKDTINNIVETYSQMDKAIPLFTENRRFDKDYYIKAIDDYKRTPHLHPDMENLW